MVNLERRLLWHPRGHNTFVVGSGSQITLYEWSPKLSEIRHLSSQYDLQFMRCLAWSPDTAFDDLFAVGSGAGKVDLLRLQGPRHALQANVLYPYRSYYPNLLAVGLDKVRGEGSLMIWNVDTASSHFSATFGLGIDAHTVSNTRPKPQIPRVEMGPRTDPRMLQQHAQSEVVSSVAFLRDSSHVLLAGISYRWLRLFDLRTPVPYTVNAASKISGIATDPLDPNRLASWGEGVVTIWDSRKLPQPVLTFTEKDAAADGAVVRPQSLYTHVEFSSTRRGTLGVLESQSTSVRLWDLMESRPQPVQTLRPRNGSTSSKTPVAEVVGKSELGVEGTTPEPSTSPKIEQSSVRNKFEKPLASFSLVPSPKAHPLSSDIMVVNYDGDLELYAIYDTPKQLNWSTRGDFSIGVQTSHRIFPGLPQTTDMKSPPDPSVLQSKSLSHIVTPQPVQQTPPVLFGRGDKEGFPALGHPPTPDFSPAPLKMRVYSPSNLQQYNGLKAGSSGPPSSAPKGINTPRFNGSGDARSLSRGRKRAEGGVSGKHAKQQMRGVLGVVQGDISMTMKRRALEGYGLSNPLHNALITTDEEGMLSDLWTWMAHASDFLCLPISRINGYDFAHVGVIGIWEGFTPNASLERSGHNNTATPSDDTFQHALIALATRKGNKLWKPSIPTARAVNRQVALQLCGWNLVEEEFTKDIRRWEKEGKISRAAVLASFYEAILTFVPILTHLTSGEWSQILEEEIFPLKERLAIALQFVDDKGLTSYLRRCTDRAASQGYIDSLVITGLTKRGLDILQGYIDHTGDAQTAAILGSFVHETKMSSRDGNRDMLDGMKLFHHRVGFDIERGQIVNDAMQSGDFVIRCGFCSKSVLTKKEGAAGSKGYRPTVCQNCERSLPRCSVCLMVLRIVPDDVREAELVHAPQQDTIDEAIVVCQTCRHAGHASHLLEWFFGNQSRGVCPVANCECRCADEM
ncbi:hypothetical protein DL96DRAFT_1671122 [Flagelloscypha sp. PMI_526]|nr:hypothetical protein DL96DRAFT_1671122 [Flagelloscypha sp. PMI_526]